MDGFSDLEAFLSALGVASLSEWCRLADVSFDAVRHARCERRELATVHAEKLARAAGVGLDVVTMAMRLPARRGAPRTKGATS